MKKHLIFDLDGTLTESRKVIDGEMYGVLSYLKDQGYSIVVISGAEANRIKNQLGGFIPNFIMGQSGAEYFKKKFNERNEIEVLRHVSSIQKRLNVYNWGGGPTDPRFVEHRGSQMTFSLTGFDCDLEVKKDFDPTGKRRRQILEEIPFFSLNLICKIAGTTSLDYTYKDYTKGKNIERLIQQEGWNKEECVYFGDKLQKGGNDETVVGVIETVSVLDSKDTLEKIKMIVG